MSAPKRDRIAFLDWIRGLACIGMFETHGYDAWLSEHARHSGLFRWSQLAGTLPAPLFLFASGISLALVLGRAFQKGIAPREASRQAMVRGAEIFAFGVLFRLQEYVLGQPHAPWTDLLRVDILNIIGIGITMMALVCWMAAPHWGKRGASLAGSAADLLPRRPYVVWSVVLAALIAVATPPLWTTRRPHWLPWYLESYINGVHNSGTPQPWVFPVFPWVGFAFAGLAFGFLIFSPWARAHETHAFVITGFAGAVGALTGWWLDARPMHLYAVYDFWHTSPNFFLIRTGVVLAIVFLAYAWCHWGAGLKGFSPVIEMGRTSLFVYWLHIEFVYGQLSILRKGSASIPLATGGILGIVAAMTIAARIRNGTKGCGLRELAFWRRLARIPA